MESVVDQLERLEGLLCPRYLAERNVSMVWICLWRFARGIGITDWFLDVAAVITRYYLRLVKVSISATCDSVSVSNYLDIASYGKMKDPGFMDDFMTLVSGHNFTIAYNEFGWIGWGDNQYGQLGNGNTTSTSGEYVRGEYDWQENGKISKIV
jgi:hypothetical protein